MKRLPIGIQDLGEMIDGGYIYVDKTEYMYTLTATPKRTKN